MYTHASLKFHGTLTVLFPGQRIVFFVFRPSGKFHKPKFWCIYGVLE